MRKKQDVVLHSVLIIDGDNSTRIRWAATIEVIASCPTSRQPVQSCIDPTSLATVQFFKGVYGKAFLGPENYLNNSAHAGIR